MTKEKTETKTASIFEKFQHGRERIHAALLEREEEADLMFIAMLAGEHLLLVGDPGTAKSQMLRALSRFMRSRYFEYILTRFTEPTELFGPPNLKSFIDGRPELITDDMLPDCELCFCDELFKSSSALLNCLLGVLVDRVFRYGRQIVPCKLELLLAASNEYPNAQQGGEDLNALYDRLLVRKNVKPVLRPDSRERLMWADDAELMPTFEPELTISVAELHEARRAALDLKPSPETVEIRNKILAELLANNIVPGDRRLRKSTKLVQAAAWLDGAKQIEPEHLEVLSHAWWVDPIEQPGNCSRIVAAHANPSANRYVELMTTMTTLKFDENVISELLPAIRKLTAIAEKMNELKKTTQVKSGLKYLTQKIDRLKDLAVGMTLGRTHSTTAPAPRA